MSVYTIPNFIKNRLRHELTAKEKNKLLKIFKNSPVCISRGEVTGQIHRMKLVLGLGVNYVSLEGFLHEACHLAEIPVSRIFKYDFGFSLFSYKVKKALNRECRTFAYESSLFEYLGRKLSYGTIDFSLTETNKNGSSGKISASRLRPYCMEKIKVYKKTHTLEKFKEKWDEKMKFIRKTLKQRAR